MGYVKIDIKLRDDKRSLGNAIRLFEEADLPGINKDIVLGVGKNGSRRGGLIDMLGCSDARKRKYVQQWRKLGEWLGKDYRDTDKRDIQRLVNIVKSHYPDELAKGRIRAKTRRDYKQALKLLYTLLEGEDSVPPPKVAWIKTGLKKKHKITTIRVLNVQERIWLIESAKYLRDKALIACLCDGLRPDELLYMRVGDVKVEDDIAWAMVAGYKGTRRVDFIWATPFLLQWIEQHPFKHNPYAPMWVHLRAKSEHDYIKYKRLEKIVPEVAARAEELHGLNRDRVWAYLLRHSRATELANFLSDAQMDEYFGWEKGSPMPQVYVHLSGKNVGKSVKRLSGIKVEVDEREELYKIKRCYNCKRVNTPVAQRCYYCNQDLTEKPVKSNLGLSEEEIAAIQKVHEIIKNSKHFEELRELGKGR